MNCTLTDVSRENSYASFEAIFKKPIYNIRLDIGIFNKLTGVKEFKTVLSFSKVDVCRLTELIDTTFAILKPQLSYINETLNGVFHPCPYKALKYPKVSLALRGTEKFRNFHFANGKIKISAQIYNNRDKNIFFYEMIIVQNLVTSS